MSDLISRQAAIKAIENLQDCYNGFSDTYDKACIIGALEELPSAQPEAQLSQEDATLDCISRIAVYDRVDRIVNVNHLDPELVWFTPIGVKALIAELPSAQPDRRYDEWCTDCKEYDQEKHCCPRWNRVIRTTLQDAQRTGRWTIEDCHATTYKYCCSNCKAHHRARYDFCPSCGAEMEAEE